MAGKLENIRDTIELVRGSVFGWRKLGVLIGILLAMFIWLFKFTVKVAATAATPASVTVPDLPLTFASTTVVLFLTFVVGNWKEHEAKGGS